MSETSQGKFSQQLQKKALGDHLQPDLVTTFKLQVEG